MARRRRLFFPPEPTWKTNKTNWNLTFWIVSPKWRWKWRAVFKTSQSKWQMNCGTSAICKIVRKNDAKWWTENFVKIKACKWSLEGTRLRDLYISYSKGIWRWDASFDNSFAMHVITSAEIVDIPNDLRGNNELIKHAVSFLFSMEWNFIWVQIGQILTFPNHPKKLQCTKLCTLPNLLSKLTKCNIWQ